MGYAEISNEVINKSKGGKRLLPFLLAIWGLDNFPPIPLVDTTVVSNSLVDIVIEAVIPIIVILPARNKPVVGVYDTRCSKQEDVKELVPAS